MKAEFIRLAVKKDSVQGAVRVQSFFRVHWRECRPFSRKNAWSAPWGSDEEKVRGYSCFSDPYRLASYFEVHGEPENATPVICFRGVLVGAGPDNEDLALPRKRREWTTWKEFKMALEVNELDVNW